MTLPTADDSAGSGEPLDVPTRSSDVALELLDESSRRRLTGGELLLLFEEAALDDLERAVRAARSPRGGPGRATYAVGCTVRCADSCSLDIGISCAGRVSGPPAVDVSPDGMAAVVRGVLDDGGRCRTGCDAPPRLDACEALLRDLKTALPGAWIHGGSPDGIHRLAASSGLQTLQVTRRLREAGLDSLSGEGAGILSDRLRSPQATGRADARRWIEISEEAHYLGLPTTTALAPGVAETQPERVAHLLRLRESQDRTSGYVAFSLRFRGPGSSAPDPRVARDDLRTLAVSALALDNVTHIQARLVGLDDRLAGRALSLGATDLDDFALGATDPQGAAPAVEPRSGDGLAGLIRAAGLVAVPRDFGFNVRAAAPPADHP